MTARFPVVARFVLAALTALTAQPGVAARGADAGLWLDKPLASWNKAGSPAPAAAFRAESRADLVKRCSFTARESTPGEQALSKAGWVPYLHFDRQMVKDDVEIIGGLSAATATCEPAAFNVFVFVGGRFAGTLSPAEMTSRRDGAIGAIRLMAAGSLSAEFARYASTDSECCPSSHVRVTFSIDRTGAAPIVVPVDARQVRG